MRTLARIDEACRAALAAPAPQAEADGWPVARVDGWPVVKLSAGIAAAAPGLGALEMQTLTAREGLAGPAPTPQQILATVQAVVDAQDKTERAKGASAVLPALRTLFGSPPEPPSQRGPGALAQQDGGDR